MSDDDDERSESEEIEENADFCSDDSEKSEKSESEEEEQRPAKKTPKRKKGTKQFERVLESARKCQQKSKFVPHREDDSLVDVATKKKPETKRRKLAATECPLASSIGVECLDQRINNSKATEFVVERTFLLKHTRYLPFGTTAYYQNSAEFYSKPRDLCCLHCTESFSGLPLPVPFRYSADASGKEFVFWVQGQCCTPSCLVAHAPERRPLVRLMLKKIYNIPMNKDIVAAPDRRALAKFGGMLSIEQFRATGSSGINTCINMPPFLPVSAGIVEIERTETVVKESGGAELARRRIRGRAAFSNFAPFQSAVVKTQKARFATAPTIDEQIRQTDEMMRLQIGDDNYRKRKNATILSFLKSK